MPRAAAASAEIKRKILVDCSTLFKTVTLTRLPVSRFSISIVLFLGNELEAAKNPGAANSPGRICAAVPSQTSWLVIVLKAQKLSSKESIILCIKRSPVINSRPYLLTL
ncbi:hypothetical protein ES707_19289 [subsurface metagenome]